MALVLDEVVFAIRPDLARALEEAWARLGQPGTWWTGAERLAIAAEARHAIDCAYCARCKQAISPFAEQGEHDTLDGLSAPIIDVVHRLINDSGRLTPTWYQSVIDEGLSEPAYVETVAIVVTVIAVDTFHRAVGLTEPSLPEAQSGEPSGRMPSVTYKKFSWVATVPPRDAEEDLRKAWWPDGEPGYVPRVHQAMSLVPDEVIAFRNLSEPLYLSSAEIMDFEASPRSISRAQMELIAARVSALNECFY